MFKTVTMNNNSFLDENRELEILVRSGDKEWKLNSGYNEDFDKSTEDFKYLLGRFKKEYRNLKSYYQYSKKYCVSISCYREMLLETKNRKYNENLDYARYLPDNIKYYNNIFKAIKKAKKTPFSSITTKEKRTKIWNWEKTELEEKIIVDNPHIISVVITEMHNHPIIGKAFKKGYIKSSESYFLTAIIFSDGVVWDNEKHPAILTHTKEEMLKRISTIAENHKNNE